MTRRSEFLSAAPCDAVILADRWEPYYRTTELRDRLHLELTTCGPGLEVREAPPALASP